MFRTLCNTLASRGAAVRYGWCAATPTTGGGAQGAVIPVLSARGLGERVGVSSDSLQGDLNQRAFA